jgi:N-acylneuraminate cytidylyltransferase
MIIAVIPARGGSKRIPRKNIKNFLGKPIIAYPIKAALNSGLFDKVIVSTDDKEIAEVAKKYGAEVPYIRPSNISDDYTGTNAVVRHAIQWFLEQGETVEYACCIYATAPFLQPKYIQEGFNNIQKGGLDFSFSVTTFAFPVQRSLRIKDNGIEPIWSEFILERSQDLEEAYHDAGQFYWGASEAFTDEHDLFSSKSRPVIIPRYLTQDIDTLEDWKYAESMFRVLTESEKGENID